MTAKRREPRGLVLGLHALDDHLQPEGPAELHDRPAEDQGIADRARLLQLGDFTARPVETSLLWGRLDLSILGIQVMGIGWLLLAGAYAVVAVAVWRSTRHALSGLALVTMVSLGFTILASPTAIIGLVVNLVIAAGLIAYEVRLHPTTERDRPPTLMTGPTAQIH